MAATDKPKGPEAFRTISEVGQDLDLPQHVLRFWETRFTQIKPMKRGGGRRYYRPEDVDLLKGIRLLLYGEGFTIRGVQRLLKDRGIAFVAEAGRNGSVVHEAAAPDAESEPDARRSRPSAPEIEVPDDLERDEDSEEFGAAPAHGGPEAETASPPPRVMIFEGDRLRGLERALVELAEAKRILEEA